MATLAYKDFTLTDATVTDETSEEWGPRENQLDEDIIDTIVSDCISDARDNTGHKHGKVYNIYGQRMVDAATESSVLTVGVNDDFTGTVQSVNNVIGNTSSHFRIIDMDGIDFVDIDAGAKTVKIGAITAAEDAYGASIAVNMKVGHYLNEAFTVEDSTTGQKPIVVDNNNSEVDIGGNEHVVNIGSTGSSDINIGRTNGNIITNRIIDGSGAAFRILEGSNVVMLVDTRAGANRKTQLGTGINSLPLTIDGDGNVYTRDVFDVDHVVYGLTSITREVVELITIGAQSYIHISLAGTKDGSDLFVSIPLSSAFDIGEGEVIGTTLGINNITEVVVGAKKWANMSIGGIDIHLIPIGGTPEATTWSNGNPCSVSITIPFVLSDPEFANEIPT